MSVVFPPDPELDELFPIEGIIYQWDGAKWISVSATNIIDIGGQGVPPGGTTGDVLVKVDDTNYNTEWSSSAGAGSSVGTLDEVTSNGNSTLNNIITTQLNISRAPVNGSLPGDGNSYWNMTDGIHLKDWIGGLGGTEEQYITFYDRSGDTTKLSHGNPQGTSVNIQLPSSNGNYGEFLYQTRSDGVRSEWEFGPLALRNALQTAPESGVEGQIEKIGGAPFYYDGTDWRQIYVLPPGQEPSPAPPDPSYEDVQLRMTFDVDSGIDDVSLYETNTFVQATQSNIATGVKKYGTGSLSLQEGRITYSRPAGVYSIGIGDFTAECWVNFFAFGSDEGVFAIGSNVNNGFEVYKNSNDELFFRIITSLGVGRIVGVSIAQAQQWHHVMCVRKDGKVSYYFNGSRVQTYDDNGFINDTNQILIGSGFQSTYDEMKNGYIDDFRFTTDARYDPTLETVEIPTGPLPISSAQRLISHSELRDTLEQSADFNEFKTGMLQLLQS